MAGESELAESGLIGVEVAYALPERQTLLRLKVPVGTTAEQAVQRSGLLERYPELDLSASKLGVFAKVVPPQRELREGDRVEIYRPLLADPKAVRQKRAEEGKKLKKGGG
jgi:putative ubiquitin-RnfH superfamily antitoxin RatB of RatAB toxin-antitoxin module